ncbi:hydrolase TatD [Alkalihalobacillus alcalophilus ATCC 27647 = CGMCC 1.3604]|uniref:Hydrolase TatD n=1 Tax=Alkalihalobacillus alcalophilus ATCC 27647 = CGMCC 1.3604 TaxID=1218173 RepID=A0A094WI14_ALKAL|nr:TatD family hydrolase [Alkalihalobacillus alcalophilus]KGA96456.1 hydrolase TatD [Alkalihalobacillus alcalophilus ATCC 27647 = CGMCC 1.3604]MED1560569.1 TatD family hydrolase [Alkalihalobacillus alcalophilus]THG90530.1 hydrolase TatD [Alkalihalobacillus alcalophilus ATCC 27647 = CGMCC 1.3604]
MLFDTHVHLNADQFDDDLEEVIQRAEEAGVKEMVVVGFDEKTINRALKLIEKYEQLYAAVGWHPVDAIDMTEDHLKWLEELAAHPKVVALGEMGLDYHWDKSPKEIQKQVFRQQIALAKKVQLPIIIHNRDADQDVVDILREEKAEEVGGIMHCFGGSVEIATQCLDMNFYISLGGPVTFKNAKRPKLIAKEVPLERLLIETDCPYLAPHPFRGKRNEPAYVELVAKEIAELREMSLEEIALQTRENAKKLFKIK